MLHEIEMKAGSTGCFVAPIDQHRVKYGESVAITTVFAPLAHEGGRFATRVARLKRIVRQIVLQPQQRWCRVRTA